VYFDSETDEPLFLRVTAGMLRHRTVLVPAAGVTATPEHLTAAVDMKAAKSARPSSRGAN
jgi:hypothetical protein